MRTKILVVVDMQNDFIDGVLGSQEAQKIVSKVKKRLKESFFNNELVIYTQDTHFKDYLDTQEGKHLPVRHCIKNTDGWKIRQSLLDIHKGDDIIEKIAFGSYDLLPTVISNYLLENFIDENDVEITLIGLDTDICVLSNAVILKSKFTESLITVDASCCAGVTPESHKNALKCMKMIQINVINE